MPHILNLADYVLVPFIAHSFQPSYLTFSCLWPDFCIHMYKLPKRKCVCVFGFNVIKNFSHTSSSKNTCRREFIKLSRLQNCVLGETAQTSLMSSGSFRRWCSQVVRVDLLSCLYVWLLSLFPAPPLLTFLQNAVLVKPHCGQTPQSLPCACTTKAKLLSGTSRCFRLQSLLWASPFLTSTCSHTTHLRFPGPWHVLFGQSEVAFPSFLFPVLTLQQNSFFSFFKTRWHCHLYHFPRWHS